MRAVLDACVLYPTVLREVLSDVAAAGQFAPVWSPRILDEWLGAARRRDDGAAATLEREALTRRHPDALCEGADHRAEALDLPDDGDRHVIETALAAQADVIVTANLRDFPLRALGGLGLRALHPDPFLLQLWALDPAPVQDALASAHARACALAPEGEAPDFRALMKRARLPRVSRAVLRVAGPELS